MANEVTSPGLIDEPIDENLDDETNTEPTQNQTLSIVPSDYPTRVYQHTTAAFKGRHYNKWVEMDKLRAARGLKSINQISELKTLPEWIDADEFFHNNDAEIRVLQKQWNKDNPTLFIAKKAAAKRKRDEKEKNGKRKKVKRGSKKSRRGREEDSSLSDEEDDSEDEDSHRAPRRRRYDDEEETHYFDNLTNISEEVLGQVVGAVLRGLHGASRSNYHKRHAR